MKTWKKVTVGGLVFGALMTLIMFLWYVNANDTEIQLRNTVLAKQEVTKNVRDELHSDLANQIGVPREFMESSKEAFKEIYPDLISGRYDDSRGGALMSWITESNPQFDMSAAAGLYENVQISLKSHYADFRKAQDNLVDAHKSHKDYIMKTMNNVFWNFRDRGEVEIVLLRNNETNQDYENDGVYETHNLFEDQKEDK